MKSRAIEFLAGTAVINSMCHHYYGGQETRDGDDEPCYKKCGLTAKQWKRKKAEKKNRKKARRRK